MPAAGMWSTSSSLRDGSLSNRAGRHPIRVGLVSLGFGDNLRFGGTNAAPGWSVPLTRATIVADSVMMLRHGRLVNGALRSRPLRRASVRRTRQPEESM